jgi:transcription-repair coupling factor
MSTSLPPNANCQAAQTKIQGLLEPFLLTLTTKNQPSPLLLSLSPQLIPLFLASWRDVSEPVTILTAGEPASAHVLAKAITAWSNLLQNKRRWHTIPGALSQSELEGEIITPASEALHVLLDSDQSSGFIISEESISQVFPDPSTYYQKSLRLTTGETVRIQDVTKQLSQMGYTRHQQNLEKGSFRIIGEKIDIAPPANTKTYTLTWFGPYIERITSGVGRDQQVIPNLTLPPIIFPQATVPLTTLLTHHVVIASKSAENSIKPAIIFDSLHSEIEFPLSTSKSTDAPQTIIFYRNFDRVRAWATQQEITSPLFCPHPLAQERFDISSPQVRILSESQVIEEPLVSKRQNSPISIDRARQLIGELTIGKPAVHADHGIGIFEGLQTRYLNKQEREYLVLRYADGDTISIPVEFAHKVTPYLGETTPVIHHLGGTIWQKTRRKAQHDAIAFAQELLTINRARTGKERSPYVFTQENEMQLAENFPFTLTPDQATTWEEVKNDLEKEMPMDRLVVGDVGFGKTEIAIRAAYHATKNGQQVAVIAPTTLLVQQHFDTFQERLPQLKDTIHSLSRFIPASGQKKVKANITNGQASIVVGTHALLSKSIEWKNLGLVIIDEEQRFGVKHKEHFKKIRSTIDVLSLSATPIPRTLSMALSGLRQLSLIQTPPPYRLDVKTHVGKIDETILKKALARELERGGQAYVVAPKIRQLASIKEHVAALLPHARLAVAHGQMDEKALSNIIHQFDAHEIDILITSSIIEHGLDLPLTNTIVVWHALSFGLADLYQLRGRIGRRQTQGYAYFFYNQTELTSTQRARLAALVESERLGSGWLIAQRDLEIRGAGNLLGKEQHGVANAVGIQLYLDLLNQAVEEHELFTKKVELEIPLPAALTAHYIADMSERTRWYQRLTRTRTTEQLGEVTQTLTNTYGPLPMETESLLLLIKLQRVAAKHDITFIGSKAITPPDEDPYERLEIRAQKLPTILSLLTPLGNWRIRGDKMTLDIEKINSEFIQKLLRALQ